LSSEAVRDLGEECWPTDGVVMTLPRALEVFAMKGLREANAQERIALEREATRLIAAGKVM